MNASPLSFQTFDRTAEHRHAGAQNRASSKPLTNSTSYAQESTSSTDHDFGQTLRDHLLAGSRDTAKEDKAAQKKQTDTERPSDTASPSSSKAAGQQKDDRSTSPKIVANLPASKTNAPGKANESDKGNGHGSAPSGNTAPSLTRAQHKTAQPDQPADDSQSDRAPLSGDGQDAFLNASAAGSQAISAFEPAENPPAANPSDESLQVDSASPLLPTVVPIGDLALAMRISTATSSPAVTLPGVAQRGVGLNSLGSPHSQISSAGVSTEAQPRRVSEATQLTGFAAGGEDGAWNTEPPKSGTADSTHATHPADFEAELQKYQNEPVRAAHVQIAGADNQQVNIHLFERAGTLSVSVKSGDNALTKAIQDHVPELNARLASNHFRTEFWTPDTTNSSATREFRSPGGTVSRGWSLRRGLSSGAAEPPAKATARLGGSP